MEYWYILSVFLTSVSKTASFPFLNTMHLCFFRFNQAIVRELDKLIFLKLMLRANSKAQNIPNLSSQDFLAYKNASRLIMMVQSNKYSGIVSQSLLMLA